MTDNVKAAIEQINRYLANVNTNKFILAHVNNSADYLAVKNAFMQLNVMKLSTFCPQNDELPDWEAFLSKACGTQQDTLILGVSEFLKLHDEITFLQNTQILSSKINSNAKVIMLFFDCEILLKKIIESSHIELQKRIIFVKGEREIGHSLKFVRAKFNTGKKVEIIKGIKSYIDKFEEECSENCVVSTKYFDSDFAKSIASIEQITTSFDFLSLLTHMSSKLTSKLGGEDDWKFACDNLGDSSFEQFLENEIGTYSNPLLLFYDWKDLESKKKWLCFIALKLSKIKEKYLKNVVDLSATFDDFIHNLYFAILEYPATCIEFWEIYNERKKILSNIDDETLCSEFCSFVGSKSRNRIYYLTDNTSIEKEHIITWLSEVDELNVAACNIVGKVYPSLIDYLNSFDLGIESYTNYIKLYKEQKLINRINEDFIATVNKYAENRDYNILLKTRNEVFEPIEKDNCLIFFIDALGVEFLGYIKSISDRLGLAVDITVAKANLPTTTMTNTAFLNPYKKITADIKLLDEVKHSGTGNYNYELTKLPLHIAEELRILDEVFSKIKVALSKPNINKVIVVSDHGASRLVVLNTNKKTYDGISNGTKGGRCCKYEEGMAMPVYATVENGQCVLANYDRFKAYGAPRVETHGGATLEELLVPVIVVTNAKERVVATLEDNELVVSFKITPILKLYLTKDFKSVTIAVANKIYTSTEFDGNYYVIPLESNMKTGQYKGTILGNGEKIDDITFKLVKPNNDRNLGI